MYQPSSVMVIGMAWTVPEKGGLAGKTMEQEGQMSSSEQEGQMSSSEQEGQQEADVVVPAPGIELRTGTG